MPASSDYYAKWLMPLAAQGAPTHDPQLVATLAQPDLVPQVVDWLARNSGMPVAVSRSADCRDAGSARPARELGNPVNPHLFRSSFQPSWPSTTLSNIAWLKAVLGHADYRTTERAYNMARALDAARRYQLTLALLQNRKTVAGTLVHRCFLGLGPVGD